jgi:hypothetical protein
LSDLRAAALRYAEHHWPVFPCRPRAKTPCTAHGLRDATTDRGLIGGWWETWPDANVAVRTGAVSGVLVLDVDGDDGAESLNMLEREHEPLPRTASVVTPRGGQHIYFRHPGGEIRNSAGKLGTGLDIRGDGGYVLAPPSVGPAGRRYEPDERAALAPPPAWLMGRLATRSTGRAAAHVSEWLTIVRDGLPEGKRNEGLARLVGHLLARDVDVRLVSELACVVALRFRPALAAEEVDRVVESIAGRELTKRGGRR